MENPTRSVCLIENAIDRLIEYGDRIHAAYSKYHSEEQSRKGKAAAYRSTATKSVDISVCGRRSRSGPTSTDDRSRYTSRSRSSTCSRSGRSRIQREAEERRIASPATSESILSEKETVNNFLYTVTKGDRRCTIPGKMHSKRLPDSWIRINFELFDEDGGQLLELRTEILGEALRNTSVNGKPVDFV